MVNCTHPAVAEFKAKFNCTVITLLWFALAYTTTVDTSRHCTDQLLPEAGARGRCQPEAGRCSLISYANGLVSIFNANLLLANWRTQHGYTRQLSLLTAVMKGLDTTTARRLSACNDNKCNSDVIGYSTGWHQKTGPSYLIANILKIPWPNCVEIGELLLFCNIICWTQSLTFCLKISSRCGAT